MKKMELRRLTTSGLVFCVLAAAVSGCGNDSSDGVDGSGGFGGAAGGFGPGGSPNGGSGGSDGMVNDTQAPRVDSTIPLDVATGVALNHGVTAIFNESMLAASFDDQSFVVTGPLDAEVEGELSYLDTTVTFLPTAPLAPSVLYTVTIDESVTDLAGNSLSADYVWSFTTGTSMALGPLPVNLGTAGNYVLLSKSGISTTSGTVIVGNLGVSPAAESAFTGFSQTRDSTNTFSSSAFVTGRLEASNMATPTPANLTTAIGNMETAYTDAAGRTLPDFTEHGAGDVSGLTLVPGLYKWSSGVLITSDVTLAGGGNDVWIFQIAEDLTIESDVSVTLSGGARAENVFWQIAGQTVFGTTSSVKGNVLCQTQVVLETGAALEGRALAQTAVTLDSNSVSLPAL